MMSRRLVLASILALVPFSACQCDELLGGLPAPIAVLVHDADESPPLPHLEVALSPTALGQTAGVTLVLKNIGNKALQVADIVTAADPELCPTSSAAFQITEPAGPVRAFELEDGGQQSITVGFTPTNGAPSCTVVEVHSDDAASPVLRAVIRGQGDAPQLCADRAVIDFGQVFVGATAEDVVHLTSCGTRPITITSATTDAQFPDPFTAGAVATGAPLAPGTALDIPVAFAPLEVGTWAIANGTSGTITLSTDAPQSADYLIELVGSSRRPPSCVIQVVPETVQFGNVGEGRSSMQPVIVRNIGELQCSFSSATVRAPAGSFSATLVDLSGGTVLQPAQQGTVNVTFAPTAIAGTESGFLDVVTDDPVNPTIAVPLQGTSVEVPPCFLEATPTALNWGFQPLMRTVEREVVLTNVGTEDCIITDLDLTAGAPEYTLIEPPLTQLGDTLPPPFDTIFGGILGSFVPVGESVTFIVGFKPAVVGVRPGNVNFTYKEMGMGNPDQNLDVPLSGTGAAPCIQVTPLDVDFGTVATNATADQPVEIFNCGGTELFLRGINLRGGSHPDFHIQSAPALPTSIAPGLSQTVVVRAAPTAAGTAQAGAAMYGQLEVLSDVDPTLVSLHANAPGQCLGLFCSPQTLDFGELIVGDSMVRSFVCQNQSNAIVSVSPTVAAPFEILSAPSSIAPGDAGVFTVRYTAADTTADSATITVGATLCTGGPATVGVRGTGTNNELPPCPQPTSFSPEVVWEWDGDGAAPASRQTWMTPLVSRLGDTNGDGVLTRDDMPRVVFISFDPNDAPDYLSSGGISGSEEQVNDPVPGVLRAIDGANGSEVWTNTDVGARLNSSVTPALMDLDGDGCVEIIGQKWVLLPGVEAIPNGPKVHGKFAHGNLLAFDCTGRLKWESQEWVRDPNELEDAGGIAVGDVDGDGFAEVAVGDHLYDHNGMLLWVGGRGTGSSGHGPTSVLVDVDGQPGLELVAGPTVYRANGTLLWDHLDDVSYDGQPAVADLDGDGTNEVVYRSAELAIFNGATGAMLHGPIAPPTRMAMGAECESGTGGTGGEGEDDPCDIIPNNPAILDVDGDGDLEIAVASQEILIVYRNDLSELWRATIWDGTGASGPAGFDFEADGTQNVIYADEGNVWSWSPTGSSIYDAERQSVTMFEYTPIADIDNDGHANLLAGSNEPMLQTAEGLDAWQNSGTRWAQARGIWNQHAYVEELVSELGTPVWNDGATPLPGFRTASAQCVP